eukprot:scaffold8718_cov159-Isochrysis_galbana.AAC.6
MYGGELNGVALGASEKFVTVKAPVSIVTVCVVLLLVSAIAPVNEASAAATAEVCSGTQESVEFSWNANARSRLDVLNWGSACEGSSLVRSVPPMRICVPTLTFPNAACTATASGSVKLGAPNTSLTKAGITHGEIMPAASPKSDVGGRCTTNAVLVLGE